jgi:CBS domain-containing protein
MDPKLEKFTIPLPSTILAAIECIKNNKARCAIVMNGERVAGVLSEGDIMSALLHSADVHAQVNDFVRHDFKFLKERDMQGALSLMREFGLTLVPVVDRELHLSDVITIGEVLQSVKLVP